MRQRYFVSCFSSIVFCLPMALSLPSLVSLAAILAPTFAAPTQVFAQDEGDGDDEGGGEAPANNGADDGADGDANQTTAEEEKPPSYLQWAVKALGWIYSPIFLALSFTLVALIVMNLLTARRDNVVPGYLVEEFEEHLDEKRFQEAYELAKGDESILGQVLSAGLAKISASDYSHAIEAMQEVGEEESMKLDHRLSYLALIGTISPMIGLFGTVHGMIQSFSVIAVTQGPPDADKLAEGISTALFTTLVGLAIAIPAIAAYNILRNRIARLVLEIGILSEGLMSRFEDMGHEKPAQT